MVGRLRRGAGDESPAAIDAGPAPTEAVVDWLTDFDAPAVGPVRERRLDHRWIPRSTVPGTRIPWSAVLALAAGIGAAVVAIATVEPKLSESMPPAGPAITSSAPPPPSLAPPVTPPVTPPDTASVLPDSCAEFFSWRMEKRLESHDLRLYTRETLAEASLRLPRERAVGTADDALGRMLAGVVDAECFWLHETDPEFSGVLTAVGEGRDRQLALARQRLEKLGLTRVDEGGGIRYFGETADSSGKPVGESHFFRDGLWFATHWYGYGPRGYSLDMAESVGNQG